MDLYTHIKTFNVVARCQSFSEAAHHLNVVPSVIAKRIAQLEHITHIKLFERSTRTLEITEAGRQFLLKSNALVQELEALIDGASKKEHEIEGHIKVLGPTTLTTQHLNHVFNGFLSAHPKISLDVALVDITINPMDEGFDIAVSGRSATYEGVSELPLTPIRSRLYASPAYLAQHPAIKLPSDLHHHACLAFKPNGNTWNFPTSKGLSLVNFKPRLSLDDNVSLAQAVMSDLGIAALPHYIAKQFVDSGHLVAVLPESPLQATWFKMFIPKHKLKIERIERLAANITEYFQTEFWQGEA